MQHLTPTQLQDHLATAASKPVILDVREPWEYNICHLEGSLLMSMRAVPARLHELDREQEIVVICHHGVRSQQVAYFLEHQGFEKVLNLLGGVNAWAQEVDPQMAKY